MTNPEPNSQSNSQPNSQSDVSPNSAIKFPSGQLLAVFTLVVVSLLCLQSVPKLIALAVCTSGVIASGYLIIPILQNLKAGQVIREDGPQSHLKKGGTPTMGGIFVVPVGVVGALIGTRFDGDIVAACLLTLGFGLVGWLDDWQILRYKNNKGISPKTKLALQSIFTLGFCGWVGFMHPELMTVNLPFSLTLPLGFLFFLLAAFVLLGASNSTNLTDGLDGLAGGTGAIALVGISYLLTQSSVSSNPNLAIFCVCMGGSYLGFLWHNRNPARVFMGDTGSLALGGAIASATILGNLLWGLLIIGAVFIWEAISVILQVSYYKFTKDDQGMGKRLFKMAPYHHHLELSGWKETQVVGGFYIVQTLLVLGAIAIGSVR